MSKKSKMGVLAAAAVGGWSASVAVAAPVTTGDLVVYRVGDGTQTLVNTGNSVFLDEYTPGGRLVQSIPAPTVATGTNNPLIASGTAASEGLLTISADGRYLALTGYGTAPGGTTSLSGTTAAAVPRVVGVLNAVTGALDTTTALSDFASGNNPRSAYTADGTNLYVAGGAGGVRSAVVGGTTSTQLSTTTVNLRQVNVTAGQLYVTSSSGTTRIATVGTGTPTTSGQTIANLPGISTANSTSPYSLFFADLTPTVAGVDTLYVADDSAAGGIEKFSLVGTTWAANGTVTAPAARGLGASVDPAGNVSLFSDTGGTTATGGGSIYSFLDTSGYNGAVTGTAQTIATAAANESFRGLAATPGATFVAVPEPMSVGVVAFGAAGVLVRRRYRSA